MDGDARQFKFGQSAGARIDLLGDKTKRPERCTHIITFPGGAIELSRTTEGDYWAHVIVNADGQTSMEDNLHSARGEVVASRVDWGVADIRSAGVRDLGTPEGCSLSGVRQVAVLIRATKDSPNPQTKVA